MSYSRLRKLAPLWLLLAFTARAAIGGERSETLLRLVGDDAGLCIELSQLESELPAILQSPLAARVKNLQLYRDLLASDDYKKLEHSREAIEKAAGKPFDELTYELVGKSVVVAVYPTAGNSLEAVLLTETTGEKSIDWLLETWNRKQAYTTDTLKHRGQDYFRRSRTKPKHRALETLYYLRLGPIFAVSDKESMIRRVIDLQSSAQNKPADQARDPAIATRNLYDSELFKRSQQDLSPRSVARVYFNPRVCASSQKLFSDKEDDPVRRLLAEYWKRCEAIGLGLRYDNGLVVELNVEHGAHLGRVMESVVESSRLLKRIPSNAAVAVSARTDLKKTLQLFASLVPERDRAEWPGIRQIARGLLQGRDPIDDVLPALGPSWVACLVPRKAGEGFPADGLLALEILSSSRQALSNGKPSLRDSLENALSTAVNYWAVSHNEKSKANAAVVKTEEDSSSVTRWIENIGQFEPSYALLSSAVAVASSHKLAREFAAAQPAAGAALFDKVQAKYLQDENQLLLVDFAALRNMFLEHRSFFLRHNGGSNAAGDTDAEKRLARVDEVLRIFDVGFLAARVHLGRTHIVAGGVLSDAVARP